MCRCARERFVFGVCGASVPEVLHVEKRFGHSLIIWERGSWHLKEKVRVNFFSPCKPGIVLSAAGAVRRENRAMDNSAFPGAVR